MQMDAEEELKVEDASHFDAVLVGGILGKKKAYLYFSSLCGSPYALLYFQSERLLRLFSLCFFLILGNVPSDDRTSEVRKLSPRHSRHLGPLQMTTNTAVQDERSFYLLLSD